MSDETSDVQARKPWPIGLALGVAAALLAGALLEGASMQMSGATRLVVHQLRPAAPPTPSPLPQPRLRPRM